MLGLLFHYKLFGLSNSNKTFLPSSQWAYFTKRHLMTDQMAALYFTLYPAYTKILARELREANVVDSL